MRLIAVRSIQQHREYRREREAAAEVARYFLASFAAASRSSRYSYDHKPLETASHGSHTFTPGFQMSKAIKIISPLADVY
ncbi:hypothetical protein LZZ85_08260 [Terrimonas sp. NA20]|uniref:Uncharacterized protein n=1 Tax=Terrimonas ginsenosidimutans TaxID=2908004 RepID=A0ABS9KPL5_9BACT|nr:hypothetical protein [Terrimonas ginsenosidimutans]MCG2614272.1 hypothetical protein [Terrimonas ginsenosidimutans]